MLSAALSTLTVDCTDNCEGPGGGGRGLWWRRAPGAEQWLPNCVPSCQPHAQPHYHMKRHRRTFSFSPNDCSPQSCRGWGGQGGYPPHPIINNGAQSPGRRNSPCTQGLFLITASGCVSEYALADDGHLPPPPPRPPPSPGDEQAACPLCVSLACLWCCCS